MHFQIYVDDNNDFMLIQRLTNSLLQVQKDIQLHGININDSEEIPTEVLEVMMLKKDYTFPLTLANGYPVLSGRLPELAEIYQYITEGVDKPSVLVNQAFSAVNFPNEKRIHCNIIARDVRLSVIFYKTLFDHNPVKHKIDYAKFELEEPPLNLSLTQNDDFGKAGQGLINHLGIQVKNTNEIEEVKQRLLQAGFTFEEQVETAGCYALQTKIWIPDPDGNLWEVFLVIEPEANQGCTSDCICYQEMTQNSVDYNQEDCCKPIAATVETLATSDNRALSAVDFPGKKRVHCNILTLDIKRAVSFYTILFNEEPSKLKSDYAKFEIQEPRLNLSLLENQEIVDPGEGLINHLGIQVKDSNAIKAIKQRLLTAGFKFEEEKQEACCYAVQTKIWVPDPDGNRWEVFLVVESDADEGCGPDCICYSEMAQNIISSPEIALSAIS